MTRSSQQFQHYGERGWKLTDLNLDRLAEYLTAKRVAKHLSLNQLAQKARLPVELLADIELGFCDPDDLKEYMDYWFPIIAKALVRPEQVEHTIADMRIMVGVPIKEKTTVAGCQSMHFNNIPYPHFAVNREHSMVIDWITKEDQWDQQSIILATWLESRAELNEDIGRSIVLLAYVAIGQPESAEDLHKYEQILGPASTRPDITFEDVIGKNLTPFDLVKEWISSYGIMVDGVDVDALIKQLDQYQHDGVEIGDVLINWSKVALCGPHVRSKNQDQGKARRFPLIQRLFDRLGLGRDRFSPGVWLVSLPEKAEVVEIVSWASHIGL